MDINFIIQGLIIGISVSAPLGPVGVICIQKTLNKGVLAGFISGLGAAFADILFASIAGFGLSFISDFMADQQIYIRSIGGLFLLFVGVKVFFTNTIKQVRKQRASKSKYIGEFFSVFFLTLSNPITIIFFGAVFAGIGLVGENSNPENTYIVILSILTGALIWWFSLSVIVNLFRHKIRLRSLWWINKIAGVLIVILGIISIVSLFFMDLQLPI